MPSSNASWGIEVGAGGIKAIKLERDGDQVKVVDFAVVPHKKVLSTPDLDQADAVRVALGAFMSQYRDALKGASVAVSVPGHAAFARFAKLPPVEPKAVAGVVKFEAVQQIPFPIEEVEWDYQTFASPDSPDVEVGIFAITKERIHSIIALYADAGLQPDIITLSPIAVYNAIAFDLSFTDKTPGTIILDIGTTSTDLIVAETGRVWIRTFPLGGHAFTQALAETFKLNYLKAEKLKREADSSKYRKHIFQAIKPVLADLVQDVQRSISYYEDTHPGASLSRLIGVGSTFRLPGLRKLLAQQVKLDVYRLERLKRAGIEGPGASDFEALTMNMATAYGLALQGLGLNAIEANLMPISVIRKSLWKRKTPWFVAAAVLAIAAGGVSFLRPFFDSAAVNRAMNDPTITRPINDAASTGQRLKSEWEQVAGSNKPGFVAENMRQLLTRRGLYNDILSDISEMFADAGNPVAPSPGEALPFELISFATDFIPPGGSVRSGQAAAADPGATMDFGMVGGMVGEGGGRDIGGAGPPGPMPSRMGSQPAAAAEDPAGPYGAVRVTVIVESPNPGGISFLNDTLLRWLRDNIDRADRPYTIHNPPSADDVTWARIDRGAAAAAAAARQAGGAQGQPASGRGSAPLGGSAAAAGRTSAGMPPLPDSIRPPERSGEAFRYTMTWVLQLRESTKPAETSASATDRSIREDRS